MFKLCILLAAVACAVAAPAPGLLPAPLFTAASSQVIARNYNTLAAAHLTYTAPVAAYSAPLAAAPLAYSAPLAYGTHAVAPAYSAYAAAPAFVY